MSASTPFCLGAQFAASAPDPGDAPRVCPAGLGQPAALGAVGYSLPRVPAAVATYRSFPVDMAIGPLGIVAALARRRASGGVGLVLWLAPGDVIENNPLPPGNGIC